MGKQSRIKEIRKDLHADDQKLFLEGQEAGRRMEALGIAPPPECAYPQLQHLFSSIYAVTVAGWIDALSVEKSEEAIAAAAMHAAKQINRFERHASKIFSLDTDAKPDCKMGCNWCCHVRVTIKPHEAVLLHRAIESMPEEARARTKARLHTLATEIAEAPAEKLIRLTRLCPLNEEGKCTVYESRPLVCRTTHSFSVKVCEEYARRGTILPSRLNGIVMEFGRAVALATTVALEHLGMDARSYDLSNIVLAFDEDGKLGEKIAAGDSQVLDRLHRQDAIDLVRADIERLNAQESPDAA
jgi:Fe-S-cluster containining protein